MLIKSPPWRLIGVIMSRMYIRMHLPGPLEPCGGGLEQSPPQTKRLAAVGEEWGLGWVGLGWGEGVMLRTESYSPTHQSDKIKNISGRMFRVGKQTQPLTHYQSKELLTHYQSQELPTSPVSRGDQ